MTPKTQSVCKHCGFEIEVCGSPLPGPLCKNWVHKATDSHFCDKGFTAVAEPASTGEPTPKQQENQHMNEMTTSNNLAILRPYFPPASQTRLNLKKEVMPTETDTERPVSNSVADSNNRASVTGASLRTSGLAFRCVACQEDYHIDHKPNFCPKCGVPITSEEYFGAAKKERQEP